MERLNNLRRYAFGTFPRICLTGLIVLITLRLIGTHGSKLLEFQMSLSAWGAVIAGCGGGVLTWITSVSEEKIVQMGQRELGIEYKGGVSDGASAAFFSFILVIMYSYAFIFGILSLGSSVQHGRWFNAAVNVVGLVVVTMGIALAGAFFTSIPGRIERLFFHAKTSPDEFRKIVLRRGYQMLLLGTALQAIDGIKFGEPPSFCSQVEQCAKATQPR